MDTAGFATLILSARDPWRRRSRIFAAILRLVRLITTRFVFTPPRLDSGVRGLRV
jgi:hypothetical protein